MKNKKIKLFTSLVSPKAITAVKEVLESGWLETGPYTEKFERGFARMINARSRYTVMLSSGTAALHLACKMIVGKWTGMVSPSVISPANTFVATNLVIKQSGIDILWADVDLNTGCISMDSVKDLLEKYNACGMMVVHYGGMPCNLSEIRKLSLKYGIPFIEDAAHAAGASYKNKMIGEFGQYVCFSLNAKKNLPAGDGGVLVLSSKENYHRAMTARWFGINKSTYARSQGKHYKWEYDVPHDGYKYNPTDIIAAIAYENLPGLLPGNHQRRFLINLYRNLLSGVPGITLLDDPDDRISAGHMMVVRAEGRNDLIDKLAQSNIETGVHYRPNNSYGAFAGSMKRCREETPNTYEWYKTALTLPLHLGLSMDDVDHVCKSIKGGW